MNNKKNKYSYKRFVNNLIGAFILIFGVTLILAWWQDVVILFRGSAGMALALAGLVMLYMMNK